MKISGTQAMIKALENESVEAIFGYPVLQSSYFTRAKPLCKSPQSRYS